MNVLKSIAVVLFESINIEEEKKNKIKTIIKEMKPIVIEKNEVSKNQQGCNF